MYSIGIDLGGTNIAAGLVDLDNRKIVQSMSVKTRAPRPVGAIADDIAAQIHTLCEKQGIGEEHVTWVGVATPGIVQKGVVLSAVNLGWENAPLGAEVARRSAVHRCYVANDANAAALGEALWGCGQECASLIAVTLGTGIGGGIILNQKIWEGFNGFAAEVGHMIIEKDGRPCACGKCGCMEAYCSATALIRDTKERMARTPDSLLWKICPDLASVSGKSAFVAAARGDFAARAVVHDFIESLAVGISNLINIFQPDVVCVGGGISREGDNLIVPLRQRVRALTFGAGEVRTRVVAATLQNDAGIIGAALLGAH